MKIAFQKRDAGIFALAIRAWTWSKYSHCELVFSDGRAFSSHVRDGGTRFISMSYPSPTVWDFIEIPATSEDEALVRAFCEAELNCKYDWNGIFLSQVLPFRRQHPERWFCSEVCSAALQLLGRLPAYPPAHSFSPGGLYRTLRRILP